MILKNVLKKGFIDSYYAILKCGGLELLEKAHLANQRNKILKKTNNYLEQEKEILEKYPHETKRLEGGELEHRFEVKEDGEKYVKEIEELQKKEFDIDRVILTADGIDENILTAIVIDELREVIEFK